jgi:hypothetical protein
MAAAEAAAAAAAAAVHSDSPFGIMPNGHPAAAGSTDSLVLMCSGIDGPHQPTTATAAAPDGAHSALTFTDSQLFSLGSAAPSAVSAAGGSAKTGGPVSLLVGMWKILTSYLQVRNRSCSTCRLQPVWFSIVGYFCCCKARWLGM